MTGLANEPTYISQDGTSIPRDYKIWDADWEDDTARKNWATAAWEDHKVINKAFDWEHHKAAKQDRIRGRK